jgi:hypothetical protein
MNSVREPWVIESKCILNPEKGSAIGKRFQRFDLILFANPRLSLMLQPWAEISERLRRIYCNSTDFFPLKTLAWYFSHRS